MDSIYKAYNGKMEDILPTIEDRSVDVILTDPPYLYLKNQKLDKEFDEELLFTEAKRILKKDGFIVLFGRGTSFYRWNTMLADLGFTFNEEIIWDKSYVTSPLLPISRVHETVSIHTIGGGKINKVKVPYLEMKAHDINAIKTDIKRLCTVFNNPNTLNAVRNYLISKKETNEPRCSKYNLTASNKLKNRNRSVSVMKAMEEGMNEKSIIKEIREHYSFIHPTQKPVRLLERLLDLVLPKEVEKPIVLDPFAGSFSTGEAAIRKGCYPILIELDNEYYTKGKERLDNFIKSFTPTLFK